MSQHEENEYQEEGGMNAAQDENGANDIPAEDLRPIDASRLDLRDTLVSLNRVAKVVKGGRRFSFAALSVVGDGRGHVGVGFGKANEVPDAISKATLSGKKNLIRVPLVGRTVPYAVIGEWGAARVMVKPASEGTGVIAGPAVRAVMELAGVRDVLTKSLGSDNQINVVKATYDALRQMQNAEVVARRRGRTLEEVLGSKSAERYRTGRQDAINMKAEVVQSRREERTRRGTYSAGGRGDEDEDNSGSGAATATTGGESKS